MAGLLPRVVALVDAATDWPCFERCVAEQGAGAGLALRIEASASYALASCLNGLVEIADAPRPSPALVATRDTQALLLASH